MAKEGLYNICVYPPVKTNRLYLPWSNMPGTEESQKLKDLKKFTVFYSNVGGTCVKELLLLQVLGHFLVSALGRDDRLVNNTLGESNEIHGRRV